MALTGVLLVMMGGMAGAQPAGPAPAQPAYGERSPACIRLETQLVNLDRGGGDARAEQIRRYEESLARQQQELDRTVAQSRRLGCESSSFFLFGSGQPPQCDQLNRQVQNMRVNLARIQEGLERLQGSTNDRDEQRRSILIALSQNDCGPQYRTAAPAPPRQRGFFESLFGGPGGGGGSGAPGAGPGYESTDPDVAGTFKTICVRTCDGFFFPISYATVPGRFREDERTCQRMCPAAEVVLFSHRNPGEDVSRAISLAGKPYTELPNAFRYRQEFNPTCSCRKPGESWAQALGADDKIEQGDIVVTEEKAKALALPKVEPPPRAPARQDAQGRARTPPPRAAQTQPGRKPPPPAEAAAAPVSEPSSATLPPPPANERPRAVGPTFIPTR